MSQYEYIMAIDQGTTGSTVVILAIDQKKSVKILGKHTTDFCQYYPENGWVEHNLNEIWQSIKSSTLASIEKSKKLDPHFQENKLSAIGITNQRETTCFFDRKTSEPLANAIVWQCKRSMEICKTLKKAGEESWIRTKTGVFLDPYFSASKISWMIEHNNSIATAMRNGKCVVGTIDTWIVHKLTQGKSFVTEPSNASRTMLYDIKASQWDKDLCQIFKVPSFDILPQVKQSSDQFGKTQGLDFLPDGIPITGILGDQQAALFGQTCFKVGEAKCTYGTGAFLLVNKGSHFKLSENNLLTTIAWSINHELCYAFEGSSFIAGAAIQFLRDQFNFLQHASESEELAQNVMASPYLYFVPALSGLGAPHWKPEVQGAFLGLTRGTNKSQMIRAALEGIAFQVSDLILALESDLSQKILTLNVDGGAVANNILMQSQANFSSLNVNRPKNLETTALGAALIAALGKGIFKNLTEISNAKEFDRTFMPHTDEASRKLIERQLVGWERAIKAVSVFAEQ